MLADACDSGLPDRSADFVWGEDAWCYVSDKNKLLSEAVRLVESGGTIAFTDWVEGPAGMSDEEATRFLSFMKFPNVQDIPGYASLLEHNGCEVVCAEDTERFGPYVDLFLDMAAKQLTYDALCILNYDLVALETISNEFAFLGELAHAGKIAQARFVATKK